MGQKASWTPMHSSTYETESEEQLVVAIKEMQKTDPVGKEQWIAYVDAHCGGLRDPTKHGPEVLRVFLQGYSKGVRLDTEADLSHLPQVTKILQRKSAPFKEAWASFCQLWGGGMNDPLKHEAAFHVQFYTELSKSADRANTGGVPMFGMGMMTPLPPKRIKDNAGAAWGTGTGDTVKDELVNRIKNFQRSGEEQRQAWCTFCDNTFSAVRDPARHDIATLTQFCEMYGIDAAGAAPATTPAFGGMQALGDMQSFGSTQAYGGMQGFGGMQSCGSIQPTAAPSVASSPVGAAVAAAPTDPLTLQLIQRIKNYQKRGDAERQHWYSVCGRNRDPARHDVAKLQEFIQTFGVP